MKKLLFIAMAVIILLLSGCSIAEPVTIEPFSEKDFAFYDSTGREAAFLTLEDSQLSLSQAEGLAAYRDIRIGDRAITALYKLPFSFEHAVVSKRPTERSSLGDEADINHTILEAARNKTTLSIIQLFAVDFSPCRINSGEGSFDIPEGARWGYAVEISGEKVSNIQIVDIEGLDF